MTGAGKGDVFAFAALVERHTALVYRVGYRMLRDRYEAEDGCCQSDANCSPFGRLRPTRCKSQAIRFCHSAKAAERRVL